MIQCEPLIISSLSRKEKRIAELLRRQAIDNMDSGRAKLAAAVIIKGRIISLGHNKMKSHTFQSLWQKNKNSIYFHAETNAIYNSLNHLNKDELRNATLFVYRVKHPHGGVKSKKWIDGLALPCEGCMRALIEFGFKRILYSIDSIQNTNKYRYKTKT